MVKQHERRTGYVRETEIVFGRVQDRGSAAYDLYGHRAFRSRREARTVILEYIKVFYNRERLHSTLGFLSPMEFERRAEVQAA